MKTITIISLLFLFSCRNNSQDNAQHKQYSYSSEKIDSSQSIPCILPNTIERKLLKKMNIQWIHSLGCFNNSLGQTIFMLEGPYEDDTYQTTEMYILKSSDNIDSVKMNSYNLPGKEYDYKDTLIYEARIFYGNCLKNYPCSIIWYQNTLMKKSKKWEINYYILDLSSDSTQSYKYTEREIDINEILNNLSEKKCIELKKMAK